MKGKNKDRQVEVDITRFNAKGNGVGQFQVGDGSLRDVEIPFSIPGDKVLAKIITRKHRVYKASLQEIITNSPDRVPPRCKHFGSCGGCRWQQMAYSKQLELKQEELLKSFDKLINDAVDVRPILAAEIPWQYRNKMEYSFNTNADGEKFLGLIMDSSRGKVLNLTECHLVDDWFSETLVATREWWSSSNIESYKASKDQGALRTLTLREGKRSGDRMVVLTVSGNPNHALHRSQLDSFVKAIRQVAEPKKGNSKLSIFLRIQQIALGMATNFYDMHLYGQDHIREQLNIQITAGGEKTLLNFQISPGAFFQPNSLQAEQIFSLVMQIAGVNQSSIVYDLYCGTGTMGICAATNAKQVVGIDMSPESADDARVNATLNNMKNIAIFCGAVRHMLQVVGDENYPAPDIIVVDPPRPGLDPEALRQIVQLGAKKVVYVACNVKTQALNIADLVAMGYRLRVLQAIDQFPHTVHFESIALLEKIED